MTGPEKRMRTRRPAAERDENRAGCSWRYGLTQIRGAKLNVRKYSAVAPPAGTVDTPMCPAMKGLAAAQTLMIGLHASTRISRQRGPTYKVQARGPDRAAAWQVVPQLNRAPMVGNAAVPGSVSWLFQQCKGSDKFTSKAENTQSDCRWVRRLLGAHPVGGVQLGGLPARAMKARHADRIHAEALTKHGRAAAHYACRFARQVWNRGRRQEAVTANPLAGMELQGLPARNQRWTPEQVETVCAKAVEKGSASIALAVRLAYRTTLREQDIFALTWTQLEERLVETRMTAIDVPLIADAYPDLRKASRATKRTAVQMVACETAKRAWGEDYFRDVFREVADAAGLPRDLQFRDLRATGLTELYGAGASDIHASMHSGHLPPTMRAGPPRSSRGLRSCG